MTRYPMADAVRAAYRAGEEEESMEPIVLVDNQGEPIGRIQDGDYVIFYDLRGEREVELTQSFTEPEFDKFPRAPIRIHFATMIEYHPELNVRVAFPATQEIRDTLSEVVSNHGLQQAKVGESEKAVHVGYFLNGKRVDPFPGEDHLIAPSPQVDDYARVPELNAVQVADNAIVTLQNDDYRLITVNFANVDVIGHIESETAILKAVNTVDTQLRRVLDAARQAGVTVIVAADHGTVEQWYYPDGTIDTGHTNNPVPCILIAPDLKNVSIRDGGALTDLAPTILQLMNLPQPAAMTGQSLVIGDVPDTPRRVMLVILDGWGVRDELEGNLIAKAETSIMDKLQRTCPTTRLRAAGEAVGMPAGAVGNSEVGHLHIGAGRLIPADRVRIERAIVDGSFYENPTFLWAMRGAKRDGTRLHLLGIISFYSSHGSVEHLKALMEMAKREGVSAVYIHGMLGRRGERPESGAIYTEEVEKKAQELGLGKFVSIIGRFWSLDREENWDRIEKTYRWLVYGEGRRVRA